MTTLLSVSRASEMKGDSSLSVSWDPKVKVLQSDGRVEGAYRWTPFTSKRLEARIKMIGITRSPLRGDIFMFLFHLYGVN